MSSSDLSTHLQWPILHVAISAGQTLRLVLGAGVMQPARVVLSDSSIKGFPGGLCQLGGKVEENTKTLGKDTGELPRGGGILEARRRDQRKKTFW